MPATILLRPARPDEHRLVRRLAILDSADELHGEIVLAEVNGRAVAAVSVDDGRVVADPFEPTADAVELLREHVRGLRAGRADAARHVGRTARTARRARHPRLRHAH